MAASRHDSVTHRVKLQLMVNMVPGSNPTWDFLSEKRKGGLKLPKWLLVHRGHSLSLIPSPGPRECNYLCLAHVRICCVFHPVNCHQTGSSELSTSLSSVSNSIFPKRLEMFLYHMLENDHWLLKTSETWLKASDTWVKASDTWVKAQETQLKTPETCLNTPLGG